MRRSARQLFATLSAAALLALAVAAPTTVRANGFAPQANTWVATTGTPTGTNAGTSCSAPGFVVDGTNDEVEIGYAILDVLPGGTVHLCPGSYRVAAGQGYDKSFTLAGAGRNATFVLGTAEFLESGAYDSGGTEFLYSIIDSTTLSVRDLTIAGFYGDSSGGYGALYGVDFVLDRVRMHHNGSQDGDGGAIWANSVIARDSIFEDNYASDDGGAISSDDLTLLRTTFTRNVSGVIGGAFIADGDISITKSDFIDNETEDQGGAGYIESGSTVLIDHARFRGNLTVDGHGGAIQLIESTSTVRYSSFTANDSGSSGGAVSTFGGTLKVISSRFYNNEASGNGGAIQSANQNALTIVRSHFFRNRAGYAGALFEAGVATPPLIRFNIFNANASTTGGSGAISVQGGDIAGGAGPNLLGITSNNFINNTSALGATIAVQQCEPTARASVRAITLGNRIVRKASAAIGPKVRFDTIPCDPI
jgi:predicted outer membrane repeat protein